jgi:uncharacterized protein DUF6151
MMKAAFTDLPLPLPLRPPARHGECGSPSSGFRFGCYRKDCQAFARFLGRPDVLDQAGGTDIFQMPPGRVELTAGADALRCVNLGSRGVFRWYSDCCRTPVANTAGPRLDWHSGGCCLVYARLVATFVQSAFHQPWKLIGR